MYYAKPMTLEEFEGQLHEIISAIPLEFLRKSVDAIQNRLEQLQENAGAHIVF